LFFGCHLILFHLNCDLQGGGDNQKDYATMVENDEWHHFVLVKAGEGVKVYKDKEVVIEVEGVAKPLNTGNFDFRLGQENNELAQFAGVLDEVAVYREALTPADIAAHYDGQAGSGQAVEPLAKLTTTWAHIKCGKL